MAAKKTIKKKSNASVKARVKSVKQASGNTTKKQSAPATKTKGTNKKTKTNKPTNNDKSKRKTKGKTKPKRSDTIASEAMRMVEQAASILEEEISAGIIAAKKVEQRYVNINSIRSGETQEVMQRFRNDAHEVLDIVFDLLYLSINAVSGLGERALNIRSATAQKQDASNAEESVVELLIPDVLKPGESGKVAMLVENVNDKQTDQFQISTSGLLNATGDHIDASNISFDPNTLTIDANDIEKVNITVTVPEGTAPGQYSGVVQATAIQMRVLLTVLVEA